MYSNVAQDAQAARQVPDKYASVVRKIIHDLSSEKVRIPTVDSIFNRISTLNIKDMKECNLFEEVIEEDLKLCSWSKTT